MTRPPLDLSVYLVTDTAMTAEAGLGATVRAAAGGGVTVVQLRDPEASDEEFVEFGLVVGRALRGTSIPLIVNDRVHLVSRIGADGAHIGQGDVHPLEARSRLGGRAYLGLSCHTAEQVRATADLPRGTLDYLGLGPVWATASKVDHARPVGVEGLTELVRAATLPGVAIGGIDRSRAQAVLGSGVAGIAVVSAICAAEDPGVAARGLSAQVEKFRVQATTKGTAP